MNSRMLLTLPLAAVLAFPAFAQTSSSQTQDQSTTSQSMSTQPSSNPSTDAASGKQPLQPPSREGFWGRVNPFARKTYVKRQTDPIRDRVNELDDLTAANGKSIKDTDARAQAGIKLASDKANEADQHAIDAGNKATMAQQSAQQASTRIQTVETVVGNIDQYKTSNQTEIRFRPGQSVLSKNAKDALDEMANAVKGQRGYIIEVQGFSSGKGQIAISNSQKMAESVVRYLVLNHEIPVYRIYLVGMGNAPVSGTDEDAKTKRISGGRVEISLLKNDLEQLSSNSSAPTTSSMDQQQQPK
ncbi:MAG: OmpA family protein [Candidatus Sulfotelmatobacter sp.]|jgi:outer membrane protein OmpA-like peptidoglycan-associated protein